MPKAAGIPPLLRLSLALVPPMLTEMITPSYPVARRQICVAQDRAQCITRPRPRRGETVGRPRTPNYGIKVYKGGGPGTLMGTQDPTRAIRCQGHSMLCPLFSWVSADLHGGRMVSARNSRKPCGQPRNSRKIQHAPWRPLVTPERTYRLRSRARRHPEELPGRQH